SGWSCWRRRLEWRAAGCRPPSSRSATGRPSSAIRTGAIQKRCAPSASRSTEPRWSFVDARAEAPLTQAGAGWTGWLEATAAATAMRQWLWLYPIVEILHILGFVVLVGSAAMFDLRLLGFSRQLPVTGMERHLLTWARLSVLVILPTGALMFVAHATEFAGNPAFRLKLLCSCWPPSTPRCSTCVRSVRWPDGITALAPRSRRASPPGSR